MQQKSNEKGVFNGYVGDGVDMSKQFPQGRYTISSKLGAGTYGKVLACIDKKYNLPVAIKIVRKDPPIYKEAAVKEIAVLRHLGGTHGCLRLLRDFQHDGHLCISMEMYGENLQSYMKRKGKPFDLTSVRDIGLQLAHACEYMHSKSIIHTDIKTENILLAAGQDGMFTIKLVDMGSSLFMSWWHPPIIGTMEYRAPETLLQAGWSCPVDNFASGCVLAELGSGKYLLPGVREEEHLKAIEVVMEQRIPQNLMREGRKNMCKYNANLIVQSGSQYTIPDVPLQFPVKALTKIIKDPELFSLVKGMLAIDPAQRLSATDVKAHRFFQQSNFQRNKYDETFCLLPRDDVPLNPNSVKFRKYKQAEASDNAQQRESLSPKKSFEESFVTVDGSSVDNTEVADDDDDDIIECGEVDYQYTPAKDMTDMDDEVADKPEHPLPPAPKPLKRELANESSDECGEVDNNQMDDEAADPPKRPPPPAPKPLKRDLANESSSSGSPMVSKKETAKVTRSAAPGSFARKAKPPQNNAQENDELSQAKKKAEEEAMRKEPVITNSPKGSTPQPSPKKTIAQDTLHISARPEKETISSPEKTAEKAAVGTPPKTPSNTISAGEAEGKKVPTPSATPSKSGTPEPTRAESMTPRKSVPGPSPYPQNAMFQNETFNIRSSNTNTEAQDEQESANVDQDPVSPGGVHGNRLVNSIRTYLTQTGIPEDPMGEFDENTQLNTSVLPAKNSTPSTKALPQPSIAANSARKKEEPKKEEESSIEESEDVEWASEISQRLSRLHQRLARLRMVNSEWTNESKLR